MKNEKLLNVELLGFLEKSELQKLIAGARLVIVPSLWYELSPLSVLEAMAAGKVVVASRIGGIPELIKEGATGFFSNVIASEAKQSHTDGVRSPRRPAKAGLLAMTESWIDKIKKIYYDEALLKRIGQAAAEYVRRGHDPEKHYAKIMEIYRATGA